VVLPLCLGAAPTAAETRSEAPFTTRIYASGVVRVKQQAAADRGAILAKTINLACTSLARSPACDFSRRVERLGPDVTLLEYRGSGVILLIAENRGRSEAGVKLEAFVRVMIARTKEGLLSNLAGPQETPPGLVVCTQCSGTGHTAEQCKGRAWRYPAKWKKFCTVVAVPSGKQQVVAVLASSGMQASRGTIRATLVVTGGSGTCAQGRLDTWVKGTGTPFCPVEPMLDKLPPEGRSVAQVGAAPSWEDQLAMAIQASREMAELEEAQRLSAATSGCWVDPLEDALRASAAAADDEELRLALQLSVAEGQAQPPRAVSPPVFCDLVDSEDDSCEPPPKRRCPETRTPTLGLPAGPADAASGAGEGPYAATVATPELTQAEKRALAAAAAERRLQQQRG